MQVKMSNKKFDEWVVEGGSGWQVESGVDLQSIVDEGSSDGEVDRGEEKRLRRWIGHRWIGRKEEDESKKLSVSVWNVKKERKIR